MMRKDVVCIALVGILAIAQTPCASHAAKSYEDRPFVQDSAQKIPLCGELGGAKLSVVRCDRNGRILVLSDKCLLQISPDRDGQAHYGGFAGGR